MPGEEPKRGRNCPHCGKRTGFPWWALLPSNNRNRSFKCQSCGGRFDLSDIAKMASIFGGLLGIGPGIYLLGHLIQAQGGGAVAVIVGTLAVVATFGVGSMGLAWLALRLEPKT